MRNKLVVDFLLEYGDFFDPSFKQELKQELASIDDSRAAFIMNAGFQDPSKIILLAVFTGWERFYLDDFVMAMLKCFTLNGIGIWWVLDARSALRRTYEYNHKLFMERVKLCKA